MAPEERFDNTVPLGMLILQSLKKIKGHYVLTFWRRVGGAHNFSCFKPQS